MDELHPDIPAASVLLMSLLGDSFSPGQRRAIAAIVEVYFCGSGTILNWEG